MQLFKKNYNRLIFNREYYQILIHHSNTTPTHVYIETPTSSLNSEEMKLRILCEYLNDTKISCYKFKNIFIRFDIGLLESYRGTKN